MAFLSFSSPYIKVVIVSVCLGVVAFLKYGLGWSDNNIVEKEAENIITEEIGVPIELPDLPSKTSI